MTPPTRKVRLALSALPAFLAAPLLAAGLSWSPPAQATIATDALASFQGLRLIDPLTVPSLPDMVVRAGLATLGTPSVWGGEHPAGRFDCIGLTQFVSPETPGLQLPRPARAPRRPRHA